VGRAQPDDRLVPDRVRLELERPAVGAFGIEFR
jgi:hypothetical protein